jgi:[ribosomal protein S18]-alanine N-acetyltransferase
MVPADLDRVVAIAESLRDAPHWPRPAYVHALDLASTPRRIALVAIDPTPVAVAGFAIASLLPPQSELETIAVAADSQRRGLGRRLFSVLADELRQAGAKELLLEVRASNATALAFYRSLGFVQTGLRPRYYADPVEDAVLMGVQLTKNIPQGLKPHRF